MRITIIMMMIMIMIAIIIIIMMMMLIPTGYRYFKKLFSICFFTLMLTVLKINSQKVLKIARERQRKNFVISTSFLW